MAAGRTLHVKCATWEQVEAFYTRKLRRGKLLSMKVPFAATLGSSLTLGLELPNEVVIAVDGTVQKASPIEGDDAKTWIELELAGFNDDVIARIRAMAAGEIAVPPPHVSERPSRTLPPRGADELPADERVLFTQLTAELRRLRQAAVHEVLGVDRDADPETVRQGWMTLIRRHHPDLFARRKAPAITHLAEELTILLNRAYDRLRAALVAEGRATAVGSAVRPPPGWLVGFDDLASGDTEVPVRARALTPAQALQTPFGFEPDAPSGGDEFETRARALLGQGDPDTAQEVLAAALVVYPRSRPLRSLYYVASAVAAIYKGEVMLATSQLETAIAHYEGCAEAARILDHVRRHPEPDRESVLRVFR